MAAAAAAREARVMSTLTASPAAPAARGPLARAGVRVARDIAYLTAGLATSVIAFGVWLGGGIAALVSAPFVIGLPVFLLAAWLFRRAADLDRVVAALALGRPLRGHYRPHGGTGLLMRIRRTALDPQTWRDLAWLVVHSVVGFGFGVAAVTLVASTLATALLPAWSWAIPDGLDWGIWTIDTVWEAVLAAWLAIPLGLATAGVLRVMTWAESSLARAWLGPR
jgi:Putative sensor